MQLIVRIKNWSNKTIPGLTVRGLYKFDVMKTRWHVVDTLMDACVRSWLSSAATLNLFFWFG